MITTQAARIWIEDDIVHCDPLPGVQTTTTRADAEEIMASMWEMSGHRRLPMFIDVRTVTAIDRAARVHFAGPAGAGVNLAAALLVGSPLRRAIGNFFVALDTPLVPCRLFTSKPEALAWLRGLLA